MSTSNRDTEAMTNELVALLRLTRTEAHLARVRTAQARTDGIRKELEDNAREADQRAEQIQAALRRLGGTPDVVSDVVGYVTAVSKSAAEQAAPLSEGLLNDLALEHQLRDRVVFTRVLAEAQNDTALVALMRQLEAAHVETIEWIRVRLAELAQGGPVALAPTPAQATVGTVARLATMPVRQSVDLVNKVVELVRRGRGQAEQALETTRQRTAQTTRAAEEVLSAGRDAALARAEQVAPSDNVRTLARQTRKDLGVIEAQALPVAGYDDLTGQEAIEALKRLQDADDVRLVLAYEQAHKDRKTVANAADKRLTELAEQAVCH